MNQRIQAVEIYLVANNSNQEALISRLECQLAFYQSFASMDDDARALTVEPECKCLFNYRLKSSIGFVFRGLPNLDVVCRETNSGAGR